MKRLLILLFALMLSGCSVGSNPPTSTPPPGIPKVNPPSSCHIAGELPDSHCTPGATNPAVTQATIQQTICVKGWTSTIRPPVTYTDPLKRQQMGEYGFTDAISLHEEDHLIPLELGGNPTDPTNLWPQPHAGNDGASLGSQAKDKTENATRAAVCDGRMPLSVAQKRIASDWVSLYNEFNNAGLLGIVDPKATEGPQD